MPVNLYLQECAAHEERQLLQKVAEMLASSSARKKKLVCVLWKAFMLPSYLTFGITELLCCILWELSLNRVKKTDGTKCWHESNSMPLPVLQPCRRFRSKVLKYQI